MKKQLLLGMACMSAIAFGAEIDGNRLAGEAKEGTVIFATGQKGALKIEGRVSSAVPVMKYVIFGTTDGNDMNDTLKLSDYTMSSKGKSGFTGKNQYAKVKKVVGNTTEELTDSEEVTFGYENPTFTYATNAVGAFPLGEEMRLYPYSLLSQAQLEEVAQALTDGIGTGKYTVEDGKILSPNKYIYSPSGTVKFSHLVKGELKIVDGDKYSPEYEMGRPDELSIIDEKFAQGYDIAGVALVTARVTQK